MQTVYTYFEKTKNSSRCFLYDSILGDVILSKLDEVVPAGGIFLTESYSAYGERRKVLKSVQIRQFWENY